MSKGCGMAVFSFSKEWSIKVLSFLRKEKKRKESTEESEKYLENSTSSHHRWRSPGHILVKQLSTTSASFTSWPLTTIFFPRCIVGVRGAKPPL